MMKRFAIAGCLAALPALGLAQDNAIYKCVDKGGEVSYTNMGNTKGKNCTRTEGQPITTVTSPKSKPAAKADTPANFPKVDEKTQRGRDDDRKRILEEELKTEQNKLAEYQKEYNEGQPERRGDERNYQKYIERADRLKQDIERTEKNIEALKKELART